MTTYQYGDLPQIPLEEQQYAWHNDHMAYRHPQPYGGDEYESMQVFNTIRRHHTMERFLDDESPLSVGMLQAKMPPYIHHDRYEQWPAPEHARYDSPGGTSVSERSSHATQNEVCSPYSFHSASYGSPDEYQQAMFVYPSSEFPHEPSYTHTLPQPGGNMAAVPFSNCNPRDLEYEHAPEQVSEEVEPMLLDNDATFEQEPPCKVESTPTAFKEYAEPGGNNGQRDGESVQPMEPMEPSEEDSSDAEYTPNRQSRRRRSSASTNSSGRQGQRRRSHHNRKTSSPSTPTYRVSKRTSRSSAPSTSGKGVHHIGDNAHRNFPCPLAGYGCQSTFSSKNEWKRHVTTQHIKLHFYRCNLCATTVDPNDEQTIYHNDFNRKDLLTQHLRRMHAAPSNASSPRTQKEYPVNEDNMAEHQARCFRTLRHPPQRSQCLFCPERFEGPNSWDQRMEHISKHLERDRKEGFKLSDAESWIVDKDLEKYLVEEGIIARKNGQWTIGDGKPRRDRDGDEDEDEDEVDVKMG